MAFDCRIIESAKQTGTMFNDEVLLFDKLLGRQIVRHPLPGI